MRWDFDLYFLMLSDMKPFFMYLLAICMSSLAKYLFSTSAHLKKKFFLLLSNEFLQRRQWQPTPVLLPVKSHGWKSLVGCSTWGQEESDMTERLHFHFTLSCIGEGNGNPLQCSRLENPRDRGAWWAAVSGVAQSRTRLKRLRAAAAMSSLYHLYINLLTDVYFSKCSPIL